MSITTLIQLTQLSRYRLHNNQLIPVTGYGTWQVPAEDALKLVYEALEIGYRHIDLAEIYGNQRECAQAIHKFCQDTKTPREDIWFTTKIWNDDHGYDETREAVKKIADDVKEYVGYVDLVLIHLPLTNKKKRLDTWKALQEFTKPNDHILIRLLGVSNYGIRHLDELFEWDGLTVPPVINQLELHPWSPQVKLREYCVRKDIHLEAYSPLTQGKKLNDPELKLLAQQSGDLPAAILLKWSYLQGFIVLVKLSDVKRMKENFDVLPPGKPDDDCTVERFMGKVDLDPGVLAKLNKPNSHDVIAWGGNDPTEYDG